MAEKNSFFFFDDAINSETVHQYSECKTRGYTESIIVNTTECIILLVRLFFILF